MKIGIITFWESNDNYGQQLQCWALQHYLRVRGYDAFLIRQYAWPERNKPKKKGIKRIKQWVKGIMATVLKVTKLAPKPTFYTKFAFCLDIDVYRRLFPKFREENLRMTTIYHTPKELLKNPPQADIYITGSDQVWNYDLNPEPLKNYFLQFGDDKVKRIAYAPSIAHAKLTDEIKPIFTDYLKSFDAISVRETSAVPLIQELGYDVRQVLDPTMLLTKDDYIQLAEDASSKPNVFIYSMNYGAADDIPFNEIMQYAKDNSLPIIVTPGSGFVPAKELFKGVEYSYATIPEWILHIVNSQLVITASFHGIVFAILFHRPFIYTLLKGEYSQSNNRVLDLLNKLGLENRIMSDQVDFYNMISTPINWSEVDEKLKIMRDESCYFLDEAIKA